MSTARDDKGLLQTDGRGDIAWQGHYFYTLRSNKSDPTGTLVRWFEQSSGLFPQASTIPSWPIRNEPSVKVVLKGVVSNGEHPAARGLETGETGFDVSFVRSDGTLSPLNPGQVGSGEERQLNTGLVEVRLALLSDARRGHENFTRIVFRVRPQR
jgi:hypothetical protein